MSKILVTGCAGFIGSHLTDKLVDLKHDVTGIDDLSTGKEENINKDIKFIKGDIRQKFKSFDFDYVFHLAAIPRVPFSVKHPKKTNDTNVNGTLNILEFSRKNNIKKVIFASSSSVYGDQELPFSEDKQCFPKSPYALQKYIGEQYMQLYDELYGLPTISLRFFNVYGTRCDPNSEYSLVISKFLKLKSEGKELTIFGNGNQSRDFTYVDDIVDGCIKTMNCPEHNEMINLCYGKNITINTIADFIGGKKVYLPVRKGDALHTLGGNNKAKKILNWEPSINITEGLKNIYE